MGNHFFIYKKTCGFFVYKKVNPVEFSVDTKIDVSNADPGRQKLG
jgi:hypothetical protein